MQKKLHLMAEALLRSYIQASRDLRKMAVGMPAEDVKNNTLYVLEAASINEIPDDGSLKLSIDQGGIAHIPITGILTNTVTPSAAFEGKNITTYNFITESTRLAEENTKVKGITYEINTAGGDVDGVEPAAIAIAQTKKPTIARVHSSAQSAGILLASQADKIVAIGKMSLLGSVGVAAEFKDTTKAEEMKGEKSVILTSTDAPEKRLDITTSKGQQSVIKMMDEVHHAMAERIADGRKTTVENVNKNFGRGGAMTAERALAVGMIDEIEGFTTQTTNAGVTMVASTDLKPGTAPAISTPTEGKMDEKLFLAFLETNPEAKSFYIAKLATHNDKVEAMASGHETALTEAKTQVESGKISELDAKFIGGILMSGSYGKTVCNCGVEVLTNANDMKTFKMLVSLEDEKNEAAKIAGVIKTQPDGTPADQGLTDEQAENGQIKAEAAELGQLLGTAKKED